MDDDIVNLPKGISRITQKARAVLNEGSKIAQDHGYIEYDVIHLFYALITNKNGVVYEALNKLGVDLDQTAARIKTEFEKNRDASLVDGSMDLDKKIDFSNILRDVINESFVISHELGHVYVGTEHMLLAMFKIDNITFINDIKSLGIDYKSLQNVILNLINYSAMMGATGSGVMRDQSRGQMMDNYVQVNENVFYRNMNDIASEGEYSNISGRDKEIARLIHILSRKFKNNPILVGDAGVGKTAIVEGFVNRIVSKKVPASFITKKVISLDVASIISGAKLRGDIEERLTGVINEAVAEGNYIIFIDEIHTIVGAGTTGNRDSLDIANILKPYLTNSGLSVIGATTADEYTKYFETDSALARRFQPIFVDELNSEASKQVIMGIVPELERYHNVKITQDSVNEAVDLSFQFIRDRYLPDKAIDLIDEAAASLKIGREIAMEPELSDLGAKLIEAQSQKSNALKSNNYENASEYKLLEDKIIKDIEDTMEGKRKIKIRAAKSVTPELIQTILVEKTKIPIAGSKVSDKKLKNLPKSLRTKIIGQERAVDNVALAIQKSHLGLGEPNKPLASFLFLGPTGVGKTEMAKTLAKELFGSESLLFQINMSEYMEQHSVSKLIGSPPGYIGYQEGGQLTNFVRRRPYSVILFDEIEKAHPDTLNVLLQILDEGEVTDGKGVKVSLRNSIIIMTSNIGAAEVSTDSRLGFDTSIVETEDQELEQAYEQMKELIMTELRNSLRPELLNRIDLIDIFRGLNKTDCLKITELMINDLSMRLIAKGIVIDVQNEVVKKINDEGYSKDYGARNIRRKVQEVLENGLAKFLLETNFNLKKNQVLRIAVELIEGDVRFRIVT
jgi:ATP-dependent Clp protease ATP-binding subunit ClpC